MSIKAILYCRFHPEKGTIIAHQVPPGAVTTSRTDTGSATSPASVTAATTTGTATAIAPTAVAIATADEYPLFDFTNIDQLLIPRQEFCDRLVTVCVNRYRIVSHPVCIKSSRYERNEFIFNLAVVLGEEAEVGAYTSVVRKLARMLRQLEEQSRFLSREEEGEDGDGDGDGGMWGAGSVGSLGSLGADGGGGGFGGGLGGGGGVSKKVWPSGVAPPPMTTLTGMLKGHGGRMGGEGELERLPLLDELVAEESEALSGSGLLDAFEREQGKKVYALCEMIMEDLNNYCECMIPIDSANTINLKLFPTRPPPAPVYAWHVPLPTVSLPSIAASSDLTLSRIIPYIDGVASVHSISQLADTDLGLTRKAIQHLLYYGCVLLLDIFQYGAVYAPTPEMGGFVEDEDCQGEAVRYVCMGTYRRLHLDETSTTSNNTNTTANPTNGSTKEKEEWGWRSREVGVDKARLVHLYTTLRQGLTLKQWCTEHHILLSGIDVRRFITFGIIKGFLYRVHKYVVAPSVVSGTMTPLSHQSHRGGGAKRHVDFSHEPELIDRRYSIPAGAGRESIGGWYSRRPSVDGEAGDGNSHPTNNTHGGGREGAASVGKRGDMLPLSRYVDGLHCLDEVCTELGMSEKKVLEKMKQAFADLCVVHR